MKVLVIGSGGREHALTWKLLQSPKISHLYCAPGNGGIGDCVTCVPITTNDIDGLKEFVVKESIDLTIVGPEEPLTLGIADRFEESGLAIFGPSARAAELEGSKAFAKQLMKKYEIPTADYAVFQDEQEAISYILKMDKPCVVKADGLAAGKGVIVCANAGEAVEAVRDMMSRKTFGAAADRIVIEEMLYGEEISVFAITDGESYIILPPSQDHKRALDGDLGKNTGGMGAYAPVPHVSPETMRIIENQIVRPTIRAMKAENRAYKGVLYCGLMLTEQGPKVIEYNCRFGDPECQALMPLIGSDLTEIFESVSRGCLRDIRPVISDIFSVCVVLASGGYPGAYKKGKIISGIGHTLPDNTMIFHAGTRKEKEKYLTHGGRVLGITAWDAQLESAIRKAYSAAERIGFDGLHYRKDIGSKAVKQKEVSK